MTANHSLSDESKLPAHSPQRETYVRWRFLLGLVVLLVIVVAFLFWRFRSQKEVVADAYYQQALERKNEDDWQGAAEELFRYVAFRPQDALAWRELAKAYDMAAEDGRKKVRAIEIYHQAIGLTTAPAEVRAMRERVLELQLETGQWESAYRGAVELVSDSDSTTDDASVPRRVRAIAGYQRAKLGLPLELPDAREELLKTAENVVWDVDLARLASDALREQSEEEDDPITLVSRADAIMDRMVDAPQNKDNAEARLARAIYRLEYRLDGADDDLRSAIELAGDDEATLLRAAALATVRARSTSGAEREKWTVDATQAFEKLVELDSDNADAYVYLGDTQRMNGDIEKAIETWERGLRAMQEPNVELNMRLVSAYMQEGQLDEARKQIEVLRATSKSIAANPLLARSRRGTLQLDNTIELFEAKLLLADNQVDQAIDKINIMSRSLPSVPDANETNLIYDTRMTLGQAYRSTGRWEQAAKSFASAAELGSDDGTAAREEAAAWRFAGNNANALAAIERAIQQGSKQANWLAVADLRFSRQVSRPPTTRDWAEFDNALAKAKEADPNNWKVYVLAALREFASNESARLASALEQLRQAESIGGDDQLMWGQLATIYQNIGRPADADRCVERFREVSSNEAAELMLQSNIHVLRGETDEAIELAREAVAKADVDSKPALQLQLASKYRLLGRVDEARAVYEELQRGQPKDIGILYQLTELELEAADFAMAAEWEKKLRAAEGENGREWRYLRGRRLLQEISQAGGRDYTEVATIQQQIESRSPDWPPGYLLKGDLASLTGDFTQAVDSYERAIQFGDQRLTVFERFLVSLYRTQQFERAQQVLEQLPSVVPASRNLAILSAAVAQQSEGGVNTALQRAEKAVAERPDDSNARIWFAQLLTMVDRDADAERQLVEGLKLDPENVSNWLAAFNFYVGENRNLAKARQTLEQFAKKSGGLPKTQRQLVVARGFQQLGDNDKAETLFRQVIEAEPSNAGAHMFLAQLLVKSNPEEAEKELRTVLEIEPRAVIARQLLATLLASHGGQQQWAEVQRLLGMSESATDSPLVDARLRAVLLAQRGGVDNLSKAQESLELLVANPNRVSEGDRLLLASIYESQGERAKALEQYEILVDKEAPTPRNLALLCSHHLRHEDLSQAKQVLDRLRASTRDLEPLESLIYYGMLVRYSMAAGETDSLESTISQFLEDTSTKLDSDEQRLRLYVAGGQLFQAAQLYAAAEPWFRKAFEADAENVGQLAEVLAHLDRHEEAIKLVLARASSSDDLASQMRTLQDLIKVFSAGSPSADAWKQVEPVWERAEEMIDTPMLPMMASAARVMQGRTDEAIDTMTRLLAEHPQDVLVLNNLATLLGQEKGRTQEALGYVNRAIDIVGEQPYLLDTKSIILVEMGRPGEAVALLSHLVPVRQPDPRVLFRLAVAHLRNGTEAEARQYFRRAQQEGLESEVLTGHDLELLAELQQL